LNVDGVAAPIEVNAADGRASRESIMRPVTRRARAIPGILAASMALVVVAGPVAAAAPQPVTIDSHVTFNAGGNSGDFTISGTAADSGLICASGTFVDTGISFAGWQSERAGRSVVQLQVRKAFTCSDGSGTFFVKLQIQADFSTGLETFTWVVQGGTDDYAKLRGSGSGSTVRDADGNGNTNTYTGFLIG
jgi:hypothetical protein